MEQVVHIYKLGEEPKSYVYWLTKSVEERISALEILRERHNKMFKNEPAGQLQRVCKLFNSNKVKYLVVGGYAMAAHGHPQYSDAIDFWIKPDNSNAENILQVLNQFGFQSLKITIADLINPEKIIQLEDPPYRINLITSVESLIFNQSWGNKIVVEIDGVPMNFINLYDLRENKKAVGRKQDLADLDNLPEV